MRSSIIAAVVAVAASAYAEPARYTRKPALKLDVKLSERTKPATRAPAREAKPVVSAEDVLRLQLDATPIRREQEALLERLVRDTPDDDPDKPDYLFRLAELYAHQLRVWRLKAVRDALRSTARSPR